MISSNLKILTAFKTVEERKSTLKGQTHTYTLPHNESPTIPDLTMQLHVLNAILQYHRQDFAVANIEKRSRELSEYLLLEFMVGSYDFDDKIV
ncbi:hypothetical protein DPMN_054865 [Dreissena polymorpha]|uniref:Uncharacterized protein n=1 Tax=Dreissena polymorpha TaxID=45954 RepID=A0A9D4CQN9_DREPO|nr:hypothetical protein DPMN_054865 [Dreissena polymorpha]